MWWTKNIFSIEKNQAREVADLPRKKTKIGVKWVYKTNLNEKGEIEKHKGRLISKGLSQHFSVNYGEAFAPVARLETVSTILSTISQHKWKGY